MGFVPVSHQLLKCFFRTGLDTFHTEDALGSIFTAAGIVRNVHIHRADSFAFAAGDAFCFVAFDPHKSVKAHGFQKNGNRTDIFAESAVIFEGISQYDADCIIQDVADDECPKHDPFHISDMRQKECRDKDQRRGKG